MDPQEVLELIKGRRTIRKFKTDVPVENEKIKMCLEAARWAPSASNRQPWEFIIVTDTELRKKLGKLAKYGKFVAEAPVIFVPVAKPEAHPTYFLSDTAMATLQFMLQAYALGLSTCWSAVYGKEFSRQIEELLNVPEKMKVLALIGVGYSALDKPPISLRKPMEKILHYERYGQQEQ